MNSMALKVYSSSFKNYRNLRNAHLLPDGIDVLVGLVEGLENEGDVVEESRS